MFQLSVRLRSNNESPLSVIYHPSGKGMGVISAIDKSLSATLSDMWETEILNVPDLSNKGIVFSKSIDPSITSAHTNSLTFLDLNLNNPFTTNSVWLLNNSCYIATNLLNFSEDLLVNVELSATYSKTAYSVSLPTEFILESVYVNGLEYAQNSTGDFGTYSYLNNLVSLRFYYSSQDELNILLCGKIANFNPSPEFYYYEFRFSGITSINAFEYWGQNYQKINAIEDIADYTFWFNSDREVLTIFVKDELPLNTTELVNIDYSSYLGKL